MTGFYLWKFNRDQLDERAFLKNAYFYGLNQFTNKAQTDNTDDDCRSRIQDKHPMMSLIGDVFVFICRKKTQNMSCVHQAPEVSLVQNILFSSLVTTASKLLFCPLKARHGLLTKDAIFIFEARGIAIGSDC